MAALTAFAAVAVEACGAPAPPAPAAPAPPPPPPPAAPPPPPHDLAAPPIALTLIDSPTAQVFHIVDELSGWYPEAHAQYAEWAKKEMPLDDAERAMLKKHAKLRAMRRRGGSDEAFNVPLPIAEAAHAAVEKKLLTAADAADEQALLEHFESRLHPLLESQAKAISELEAKIAAELPRAAPLLARLGRFCEVTETLPIRAVLVANPLQARGSGRARRTTIAIEVPSGDDTLPTFFHYLSHAILLQRRGTIALGAGKCEEAIDDETIEDALAYAVAPGLIHPLGRDLLRELVDTDHTLSLRNPRVRAERLGLALRTDLSAALEGGHETVKSFLPKVCDAWANVARP
ncbi:MAG: hypothetical protein ACLQBL_08960 [Polyangiaceae bacterium]